MAATPHPSVLFPIIEKFLITNGLKKSAKAFRKETGTGVEGRAQALALMDIYAVYLSQNPQKLSEGAQEPKAKPEESKKKRKREEEPAEDKNESSKKKQKTKKSKKKDKKKKEEEKDKEDEEEEDKKKKKKSKKDKSPKKSKKAKKEKKTNENGSNGAQEKEESNGNENEQQQEETKEAQNQESKAAKSAPKPFKRVNDSEILTTLDPELRDNSYEALKRRGENWGDRANQILGAVKGKGFRHEKTKKKRGTYRGGSIDDSKVNSIKFD